MKKILIVFAAAAALLACRKERDVQPPGTEAAARRVPLPEGFKVLTPGDLRSSLQKQGLLPGEVEFIVANTKFTMRPEEQGQTAAALNNRLAKLLQSSTEKAPVNGGAAQNANKGLAPAQVSPEFSCSTYVLPHIFSWVEQIENTYVEGDFTLNPATATVCSDFQGGTTTSETQRFRFSGNQWYHNQAPGGCTWGYYTHNSDLLYMKSNNPYNHISNFRMYSQATFCPRANNTVCYHRVYLFFWTGSVWELIYTDLKYINPNVPGSAFWTQIKPEWRLGPGLYSLGVMLYSNGWNPAGWPEWRSQYALFSPVW